MGIPIVRRQWDVLRRAPSFSALFFATLASGLGTYLAVLALIVDVQERTGSGSWIAALLIVEFVPVLVVGLALGPLVDRLPRRSLMIAADLVRLGVFLALPFATGPAMIVVLAGVAGVATAFFRPAVYAGMPNLVAPEDLPQANSLLQTVENLTWMIGPLLGGVIVDATNPDVAYVINAATFLISALLLLRIPGRLLQAARAASEGHLRDLVDGFRLVRRSRALVTVLVAWSVVMIGNASVNVSEVFLAKDALDGGDFGLGLLMGASGLGLMLGSLVGGTLLERRRVAETYGGALVLMAVGIALAAISPNVWVASACVTVMGFGNGVAGVCNPVLVQRGAPDHLRGRAFTVIMSVNAAVLGLAMAGAGPLTDAIGPRWVWGVAAAANAVAAVIAWTLSRGIPVQAAVTDVEPVTVLAAGTPGVQGG